MSAYARFNYLAEFLGSLFVIFTVLATGNAVAIGAAIAIVYIVTNSTVNPAAAIAMVYYKVMDPADLVPVIIAQTLGALVAVEAYKNIR